MKVGYSLDDTRHLAMFVDGEAVSWLVYSTVTVVGEKYLSFYSAYTLPDHRSQGYTRSLFEAMCREHPSYKVLGNFVDKNLKRMVSRYNLQYAPA